MSKPSFVEAIEEVRQTAVRMITGYRCLSCDFKGTCSPDVYAHYVQAHSKIAAKDGFYLLSHEDDYVLIGKYRICHGKFWSGPGWYGMFEGDDPYDPGCKETQLWPIAMILDDLDGKRAALQE